VGAPPPPPPLPPPPQKQPGGPDPLVADTGRSDDGDDSDGDGDDAESQPRQRGSAAERGDWGAVGGADDGRRALGRPAEAPESPRAAGSSRAASAPESPRELPRHAQRERPQRDYAFPVGAPLPQFAHARALTGT
jgi:hypothetical protein